MSAMGAVGIPCLSGKRECQQPLSGSRMKKPNKLAGALVLAATSVVCPPVFAQGSSASDQSSAVSTLETVKQRGVLHCGVIGSAPNFSLPDSQGVMRGMDADLCR